MSADVEWEANTLEIAVCMTSCLGLEAKFKNLASQSLEITSVATASTFLMITKSVWFCAKFLAAKAWVTVLVLVMLATGS